MDLRDGGEVIGVNRVARLMREEGLVGKPVRRFKRTTDSDHEQPIAPNLLLRNFTTETPNQVWVSDISYIPTHQGFLYLSVVLDLYSRKVVGWSLASHMRTELVLESLERALAVREPPSGWIHHSDRGSQYASCAYQARLSQAGGRTSMSRKGDCWDNAVVESFFGTLKTELEKEVWSSHHEAREAIQEYINEFYNPIRRHSANGYLSPNQQEWRFRQDQRLAA